MIIFNTEITRNCNINSIKKSRIKDNGLNNINTPSHS